MMFRSTLAGVLVLFGLSLTAQAQTYKIQIKEFPDAGKKTDETSSEKTMGTIKVTIGGNVKEETINESEVKAYTLETLEKGTPRPKKFQKTFNKAVHTKNNMDTAQPYQGRTVVYELKGDAYEVAVKGDPVLPPEAVKKLREQADQAGQATRVMLPTKEVKVGETWTIAGTNLAQAFGKNLPIDTAKSSGTGKLVKAYQKDGHQFGTLEFDLKLAATNFGGAKVDTPLPINAKLNIDTAIDGSTTQATVQSTTTIQGKTNISPQPGASIPVDVNIQITGNATTSAEK